MTKTMKNDIKRFTRDDLRWANQRGLTAAECVNDDGTCCMDSVVWNKSVSLTYAEMIQICKDCGLYAYKGDYPYQKSVIICGGIGQGEKRTTWAETMAKELKDRGYETSVYYQMD